MSTVDMALLDNAVSETGYDIPVFNRAIRAMYFESPGGLDDLDDEYIRLYFGFDDVMSDDFEDFLRGYATVEDGDVMDTLRIRSHDCNVTLTFVDGLTGLFATLTATWRGMSSTMVLEANEIDYLRRFYFGS